MKRRSFAGFARKAPGIDSAKSRAQAAQFLAGARSLEHVTVEALARQCRLKPKTAEYMLTVARQRRNQPEGELPCK